jgi:hypothetical protein
MTIAQETMTAAAAEWKSRAPFLRALLSDPV